jgi:signal transduction histidine kinase
VIESSVELASLSVCDRDVDVVVFLDPDLPERVHGDAARIRQLVVNVVGNAMKLTQQGEVAVRVRATAVNDNVSLNSAVRVSPDQELFSFELPTRSFGSHPSLREKPRAEHSFRLIRSLRPRTTTSSML